jgi:uncharacterized protein YndB with AHSA1/START domain
MAEPMEDVTHETDHEIAVERAAELAVPADAVWDALTDPELLAEWFGPVEFDLRPGGAVTIAEPGDSGTDRTIGVVETVEPPHRIGFVWVAPGSEAPSSVEIAIDDDDADGSILRTREVRLGTDWDRRPAWFAPSARACAGARG